MLHRRKHLRLTGAALTSEREREGGGRGRGPSLTGWAKASLGGPRPRQEMVLLPSHWASEGDDVFALDDVGVA